MPHPAIRLTTYDRVAQAIRYLREHAAAQPGLSDIARAVGLSEFHLQRVFAEWAGLSPKRFLQYLTKEHARQALRANRDVLSAAMEAGLSGPGRLHDLMVSCEAVSPGQMRARGAGLDIGYGFCATPFGEALVAWTPRGVCRLRFVDETRRAAVRDLRAEWPRARLSADDGAAAAVAGHIFSRAPTGTPLHLMLRGTNFQIKVWEALLHIPPGSVVSYGNLARTVGSPRAARAVGTAVAANPVAVLIPCHRVIRESGELGGYRWGLERKAALLAWEQGRPAPQQRRNSG